MFNDIEYRFVRFCVLTGTYINRIYSLNMKYNIDFFYVSFDDIEHTTCVKSIVVVISLEDGTYQKASKSYKTNTKYIKNQNIFCCFAGLCPQIDFIPTAKQPPTTRVVGCCKLPFSPMRGVRYYTPLPSPCIDLLPLFFSLQQQQQQ